MKKKPFLNVTHPIPDFVGHGHGSGLDIFKTLIVTESDKIQLIAGKYICLLNYVHLHFCVNYNNSVVTLYISDENFK